MRAWEHMPSARPSHCTQLAAGVMMFRKSSMGLVNEWIDIIEKDTQVWDQNAFNELFRR